MQQLKKYLSMYLQENVDVDLAMLKNTVKSRLMMKARSEQSVEKVIADNHSQLLIIKAAKAGNRLSCRTDNEGNAGRTVHGKA